MAAAIVLALVGGIAGVATQWSHAETNLSKSEARLKLANEAIERFFTGASEDVLLKEPRLHPLRTKLLGSVLEFYKKLESVVEGESGPERRGELAAAYFRVGEILRDIGSKSAALDSFERASTLRRELAERSPGDPSSAVELARTYHLIAFLLVELGRIQEAIEQYKQELSMNEELAREYPMRPVFRERLAGVLGNLGDAVSRTPRKAQPSSGNGSP
jgi:tetratricopeptide (TPR) repeat protein